MVLPRYVSHGSRLFILNFRGFYLILTGSSQVFTYIGLHDRYSSHRTSDERCLL